jgi:hypothetical protein
LHHESTLDSELDEIAGYLNAQHARLTRLAHQMLATPESWAMPGVHAGAVLVLAPESAAPLRNTS